MSGEVVRRYNSSKRVRLNPERWMPVLRHVRPSDISTLQLLGNPIKNDSMRIVEAIVAEIHRNLPQTSADDAAGVPHSVIAAVHVANIDAVRRAEGAALAFSDIDGDKLHVAQMSAHIEPYLDALIADATLSHLLALLPETLLVRMFSRYMVKALGGNNPLSHEALHAVFLDNEHLSAQLRQQMLTDYVYLIEFPRKGNVGEALAQLPSASREHQLLTALGHMHRFEAPAAFDIFTEVLKTGGKPVFQEPLLNFAYALAVCLTGTTKSQKVGQVLLKSHDCQKSVRCYAMNLVLHHFLAKDAAQYLKSHPLCMATDGLAVVLAVAFCRHYSLIDAHTREAMSAANVVSSCSSDYLRLLCLDDFKVLSPLADKLRHRAACGRPSAHGHTRGQGTAADTGAAQERQCVPRRQP